MVNVRALLISCSSLLVSLHAATITVTIPSSDPSVANSLPWAINNSSPGDTIVCNIAGNMLDNLTQDFPAINHSLTLSSATPLTIPANNFQPFTIATGTVTMSNFTITGGKSQGGAGGNGLVGGGGGPGGGGGLYVHNGASISLSNVVIMNSNATGGAGGDGGVGGAGGGGGGGGQMTGGAGGFGAGGGGSTTTAGTSLFGGGSGGTTTGEGGGGGGAGLGGAIFIQNGATVTINDGFSASGNSVTAGAAGNNGGGAGQALGTDIFLRSGGSLIFNLNSTGLSVNSVIASDQGVGGGTGGGLTLTGTKTLTLSAANTYSGGTTIASGILNINGDAALGMASTAVTINTGTLQLAPGSTFSTARAFSLTGAGTIDTGASPNSLTISGQITGSGSLAKSGTGTLILQNTTNTYSAGTTVSAGLLSVPSDSVLGSGTLTLGSGSIFQTTMPTTSTRSIVLSGGNATIDTQNNSVTFNGGISGGGTLVKINAGTLILGGANSYTGGTIVNGGTLMGNTSSLVGSIQNNGTVSFNQSGSGTYSGALSGAGGLQILGGGFVRFTGNSASFTGGTAVLAGTLEVNGSLAGSTVTVSSGAVLGGVGTVGPVVNNGTVSVGTSSSLGTLTVSGNYSGTNALLRIGISPTGNDRLAVTGSATLTDTSLIVTPESGFYGVNATYTIVHSGTLLGTTFASFAVDNSNFLPTISYTTTDAILNVKILNPFIGFSFTNSNAESVGMNLGELNLLGELDPGLVSVLDSFAGGSTAAIIDALDQMHPASISALAENQVDINSQLLSLFHRRPYLRCFCYGYNDFWVQPFGNWLKVSPRDIQVGFLSNVKGIAAGTSREIGGSGWSIGVGGVYDAGELVWQEHRGHADTQGWYGSFYADYAAGNFYLGTSLLAGVDHFNTSRLLQFFSTDERANASFHALDMNAQLATAYFFGVPACHLYPFLNADYFFFRTDPFTEGGAGALCQQVESNTSNTLRGELGIGLQVQDTNYTETLCIAPLVAMSWVFNYPLGREVYTSRFVGEPIAYTVKGWKEFWEIFKVDFGLMVTYKCFSLSGEYNVEISPAGSVEYGLFSQRGSVRLEYNW